MAGHISHNSVAASKKLLRRPITICKSHLLPDIVKVGNGPPFRRSAIPIPNRTRSSAIAEGTRDAPCQLNRAKCRTNVRRIAFDKSCDRPCSDLQGHPRSLEMAQYDTSCYWCVVPTCVSCTISLILPHLRCT